MIDQDAARPGFLRFGDRVRMEARLPGQSAGPFGVIDQRVLQSNGIPT